MMKNVTQAEQEFYYYQMGRSGSFMTALFDACLRADWINIEKLKLGFPEEATVAQRYQNESGYWEDLLERIKG